MATHCYNKNFISSFSLSHGVLVTEHDQKAGILWEEYKSRLGISEYIGNSFNLTSFLQVQELNNLDDGFSSDEILQVIKNLPNNNALGPVHQKMLEYYQARL
jgi:hypothetical protein